MKVYNLSCEHDHRFEGWFASEEDFIRQLQAEQIACPICDNRAVVKLPSAPRLNLAAAQAPQKTQASEQVRAQAQVMELLRQVVANTEDVGERFADEARRMHYNEAPERAIRGVATPHECEALADEGIDVVALPLPAALKTPLQ
ncbi:MAG: DUF1178 family protein [Noviherbaspirillum sp.]